MPERDDGGPAFPQSYKGEDTPHVGVGGGMTVWDEFAKAALPALIHVAMTDDDLRREIGTYIGLYGGSLTTALVKAAGRMADAMLAEREKEYRRGKEGKHGAVSE